MKRRCQHCGKLLKKHVNEDEWRFLRRNNCGRKCANKTAARVARRTAADVYMRPTYPFNAGLIGEWARELESSGMFRNTKKR